MKFYKIGKKHFSFRNNYLRKEFNFSKKEVKELNNLIKEPWVKPGYDKLVGFWLLISAGVTLGMVVLGGYVRLNKAGLSMVRWDLTRLAAPKTKEEWDKEFKDYKEHPQFKNDFPDLSMEGFKNIYLLEHYHRQLGKTLGVLVIAPTVIFSMLKILNKKMRTRCLLISSVIVVQGIIGMWMVRSGLRENLGDNHEKNNVRVSHYRLATHFTFAITTYWLLLNSALFLLLKPQVLKNDFNFLLSNNIIRKNLVLTIHLVLITAIFGSLLAGQDGGKIVNTFPKMGDLWIPTKEHYKSDLNIIRVNLENDFLIHFNHRTLATVTLSAIFYQTYRVLGLGHLPPGPLRSFVAVTFLAALQYYIGIFSILNSVPPKIAHLHQFFGTMTITACIVALSLSRKTRPREIELLLKAINNKDSAKFSSYFMNMKNHHPKTYDLVKNEFERIQSFRH